MSRLSEDIILWEIVTLLPVKSVLRFRCVCKSWRCFLGVPNQKFINLHLKRTSKNPEYESLVMGILRRDRFALDRCIDILTRSRLSYTRIDNAPRHYKNLIGSINGLVCLQWKNMILLWNPATALAVTLVPPEYYSTTLREGPGFYGFGWNCINNDYKVLVCSRDKRHLQGVVYSTNLRSWTPLLIPHSYHPSPHKFPRTIVNGCPYWANFDAVTKFEVESNQLKDFMFSYQILISNKTRIPVNLRDSLVLMLYSPDSHIIDIHHLDEGRGLWTKTYTIGPIMCNLGRFSLCFKYGGEILFNNAMMLYDTKINEVKVVGGSYWLFCNGFSYTASLVFLQGMESFHTQSHWRYPKVQGWELPRLAPRSPKNSLRLIASRLLCCFLCWN